MTMQFIWISFALVLSANATIPHWQHTLLTQDFAKGLEEKGPRFELRGKRCKDFNFVDPPGSLYSKACKEGKEGFIKHTKLWAIVVQEHDNLGYTNKPYLCCLETFNLCDFVEEEEVIGYLTAVDCSGSKPCLDPKKYYCMQQAANNPNHPQHPTRYGNDWKLYPICCRKLEGDMDKTCHYEKSDYREEEPEGACEKNFGRCKADDHTLLCSRKKKDPWLSSCCKPHDTELCPGGIYPFGLKGTNGLVDWRVGNSGDANAWTKACTDLESKPEFAGAKIYISNDKCCATAKLKEELYYGKDYANLLSDQYDRFSMFGCNGNTDCGLAKFCGTAASSSYKNEPATGKACFEKLHCPHKTKTIYPVLSTDNLMTCRDSSTCPTGTICVWGKPAPATAAKIKKSFGMCCPKDEYEAEVCTAEFLGDPHNTEPGKIEPSILTQEKCKAITQKWTTIDTGGTGDDRTDVCCQYQPIQFHNSTCTAVIMGNRKTTGEPIENANFLGRYLPCDKEKKRKANEPKMSCGEKMGFCFADPGKTNTPGVCCDTELCPDGLTALSDVPVCDDKCMWNNSPEKDKYCLEDKKKIKKCCPPKFFPAPDFRSGRYEPNAPKNAEAMKMTVNCSNSRDCGGYGAFCDEKEKYCYRLGTREYGSSWFQEFCIKAADCEHPDYKNYKWWCVAFGPATGDLRCITPTQPATTQQPTTPAIRSPETTRPPVVTEPREASSDSMPDIQLFPFIIYFFSMG